MAERQYRLVVAGELGAPVEHAFEGMHLEREAGKTVLVGPVRDQASLQGLLQRVSDLGLTLLSATAIDDEGAAGEEPEPPRERDPEGRATARSRSHG